MEQKNSSSELCFLILLLVFGLVCAKMFFSSQAWQEFLVKFIRLEVSFLPSFWPGAAELKAVVLQGGAWQGESLSLLLERASLFWATLSASLLGLFFLMVQGLAAAERYVTRHNMQSLLKYNVRFYPCLAPILNWGRPLLSEDLDHGPWRVARQPLQFAMEHGLLWNQDKQCQVKASEVLTNLGLAKADSPLLQGKVKLTLDRKAARQAFEGQFGPPFSDFSSLPPYLQALALAFILFGFERKKEAKRILDQLSLSFRLPHSASGFKVSTAWPFLTWPKKAVPNYQIKAKFFLPEAEVESLFNAPEVRQVIKPHNRYAYLVLFALYSRARQKGVLATAEFIWLRPLCRELFYLLNAFGRRTVWVEVAGLAVHYQAETVLALKNPAFSGRDLGLEQKLVEAAVLGLERALFDEGWLK